MSIIVSQTPPPAFVALYAGRTIGEAQILAISTNSHLLEIATRVMLREVEESATENEEERSHA